MVDLAAAAAEREEAAVALEAALDQDDEQVDAILDHQDPGDQAVQNQSPSVVVRVVASVEVVLEEAGRLWVDKVLYSHQTADVAAGDAVNVDADVAVGGPVVVQQSNRRAVTCIAHGLRQHDDVQQPVLLLHALYLLLLWLCDEPTIQPYSWISSRCEEPCA